MSTTRSIGFGVIWVATVALLVGCPPPDDSEPELDWERTFEAEEFGWVMSAAGRSADAVYAVGGAPSDGAVRRYDGDEWSSVDVPTDLQLATWVHCFEDGRPVVTAFGGTVLWREDGEWRRDDVPTDQDLWGVWGASRDDVWAVGGSEGASEPVILRYDGSEWTSVEVPDLAHDNVSQLFKVWGTGPDDVYIVGQNGTVVHWNGEELRDRSPDTRKDLISVWGAGPDRVAVAGGRGNGVLALRDGSSWSVGSLRPLIGVNGIWVADRETAWVAGADGRIARVDLTSDDFDKEVTRVDTDRDFHAIYGLPDTGLWAVGGNLDRPGGPHRGTAWFRGAVD